VASQVVGFGKGQVNFPTVDLQNTCKTADAAKNANFYTRSKSDITIDII